MRDRRMAGNKIYVQGSYVDIHDNEVVNLSIDKATVALDAGGKQILAAAERPGQNNAEGHREEERFHFVHPELDDEEAWRIHDAIKRLVTHQRIPEICLYLKELKQKGKVMLPSVSTVMYNELVRLGMPKGEGFTEKHFSNSYTK